MLRGRPKSNDTGQVATTWLVDKTYVKILGKWHYIYRCIDLQGQVPDCWLSTTRDLPAAEACLRRTIASTGCVPEHIVTDKATFYPSAIRSWVPDAKHTATGFYNRVISTNRCERNHSHVKITPAPDARADECRLRQALVPRPRRDAIDRARLVAGSCSGLPHAGGRSYVRARNVADIVTRLGQGV